MLLTRQADIKSYPEEAVAECWKNRNGISRRANRTSDLKFICAYANLCSDTDNGKKHCSSG